MAGEYEDSNEILTSSAPPPSNNLLTLQKAVDFGTYEPEELSVFAEWHKLPRPAQYQLIKKALDNRLYHLIQQYSELNNALDFRNKPHLQEAQAKVMEQRQKVLADKERLMIEYSGG
jgi:hypothetical protein